MHLTAIGVNSGMQVQPFGQSALRYPTSSEEIMVVMETNTTQNGEFIFLLVKRRPKDSLLAKNFDAFLKVEPVSCGIMERQFQPNLLSTKCTNNSSLPVQQ